MKTILIVGDWVIDEYWFLVRHYSEISTLTGLVHYRIVSEPEQDIVRGLCGAGHVARVLFNMNKEKELFKIWGLGNWYKEDQDLIRHLVQGCECCIKATKGMKITCNEKKNDIELISLNPDHATIRVIRQYHHLKGGLEQINRVDWEPEHTTTAEIKNDFHNIDLPKKIDAIIVQDLQKGVVIENLIRALHNNYNDANWFVRSKDKQPSWMEIIKPKHKIILRFICPEISDIMNPWGSWLIGDQPTRHASDLLRTYASGSQHVILCSNKREVIALMTESNNKKCFVCKSLVSPTLIYQLGWADALFAALIYKILEKNTLVEEDLEFVLNTADTHRAITPPKNIIVPKPEKRKPMIFKPDNWSMMEDYWWDAKKAGKEKNEPSPNLGIIKRNGDLNLDIWRASTELQGYIACIKEKLEILREIGKDLKAFRDSAIPTRPLSILIQADPGSGKTTLAKALASCFNFSFVHRDITQMIHRDELIDLFDDIATRQASGDDKILVFVDEINATLDSDPVYGAFLAPLEESVYMRRGRSFSLRPCVWLFAGTQLKDVENRSSTTSKNSTGSEKGQKLSDFMSRMTRIKKIDYNSILKKLSDYKKQGQEKLDEISRLDDEARLEQIYLGALMIKYYFSDVSEVSKEVLYQFYKLDPSLAPARKIRQRAAALKNVQYGKVTRKNCEVWEEDQNIWKDSIPDGHIMVKLNLKPSSEVP